MGREKKNGMYTGIAKEDETNIQACMLELLVVIGDLLDANGKESR